MVEGTRGTLVARNCWSRTDAIPKLPSTDVDVDEVDREISSFKFHEAWFQKCLKNEEA